MADQKQNLKDYQSEAIDNWDGRGKLRDTVSERRARELQPSRRWTGAFVDKLFNLSLQVLPIPPASAIAQWRLW